MEREDREEERNIQIEFISCSSSLRFSSSDLRQNGSVTASRFNEFAVQVVLLR